MEITNLGNGLVKLTTRKFSVVVGPKLPSDTKVDVIALTQRGDKAATGEAMILDSPGEYEVGGALITGVGAQLHIDKDGKNGTIYVLQIEDTNVAVLANIAPVLSDTQLEAMGQVDVLVIPVGGRGLTLDAPAAAAIVAQVEPKVVIPTHYDDGVSTYEMPQDKVDVFTKELGATPEAVTKFKISARDLPEEMAVVVVKPEAK